MLWIGLTGNIASGKSRVAQAFRQRGVPVIDADKLVHEISHQKEVLEEISQAFGPELETSSGELNRRELGKRVFQDPSKRRVLEGILHPRVREEVARLKASYLKQGVEKVIYEIPLLFEKNLESEFDVIILVEASEKIREERLHKRDHLSGEEIQSRMNSQMPSEEKRHRAQFIIENNGSEGELEEEVESLLTKLSSQ